MKVSQMSTERALACMARMVPHVSRIVNDPELAEIKKSLLEKGKAVTNCDAMEALYPLLLDKHRQELLGILAALGDRTVDELREQPWNETAALLRAGMTKELFDFLPYAAHIAFGG